MVEPNFYTWWLPTDSQSQQLPRCDGSHDQCQMYSVNHCSNRIRTVSHIYLHIVLIYCNYLVHIPKPSAFGYNICYTGSWRTFPKWLVMCGNIEKWPCSIIKTQTWVDQKIQPRLLIHGYLGRDGVQSSLDIAPSWHKDCPSSSSLPRRRKHRTSRSSKPRHPAIAIVNSKKLHQKNDTELEWIGYQFWRSSNFFNFATQRHSVETHRGRLSNFLVGWRLGVWLNGYPLVN